MRVKVVIERGRRRVKIERAGNDNREDCRCRFGDYPSSLFKGHFERLIFTIKSIGITGFENKKEVFR